MRPIAASLLLVLAGLSVLAAAAGPTAVPREGPVRASAAAATLWLGTDKETVGLQDALTYTAWVNVSGGGQIQAAFLNLTFAAYPGPRSPAILLTPASATFPAECAPAGADAWTCANLRSGSAYAWTIPASVDANASVGYSQRANASLVTQAGSSSQALDANASVYIAGAVLEMPIEAIPAYAARAGELITFWINVTNTANVNASQAASATANRVVLALTLGTWLHLGPGSPPLTTTAENLTPQSVLAYSIQAIVEDNATPGTIVGIRALLTYKDFNGHPLDLETRSAPIYIRAEDVVSPTNLLVGATIGVGAIVATLVVLVYVGQRKLEIDEAFLIHRSGVLIQHVGRGQELSKEDDRMASMFVAIQEFVRDSFRTEALVDEVSFGGRKAAVVRGKHTVLAAVISRGDAEYVVPQMRAAVRAIESRYGKVLRAWDGRAANLGGVDRILERFLRGGFRAAWRPRLT